MRYALLGLVLALGGAAALPGNASARPNDELCLSAIGTAEKRHKMPSGLLTAIALMESGHKAKDSKRFAPWPWTINSPAGSFYLGSRREAVAKVEELKASGHTNIDVGCMQINLYHHPEAFHSLDAAFDPKTNVNYGASFLSNLRRSSKTLFDAVGRYHSGTPRLGKAYARKVLARWQGKKDLELPKERRTYTLTPSWQATQPPAGDQRVLRLYTRPLEATKPTRPHWYRLKSERDSAADSQSAAPGQIRIR